MLIDRSSFTNLVSEVGGAIYLTDIPSNKRATTQDQNTKYVISNSVFENITAQTGGALYLDHPQSAVVTNTTFKRLSALNGTTGLNELQGIGGAIYYSCSFEDPECNLTVTSTTLF